MYRRAMVAGSFDPITKGHMWLIEQALYLAGEVEVVIGVNSAKKYHFSVDERRQLIEEVMFVELDPADYNRMKVTIVQNEMLASYAIDRDISLFVRGVRNTNDYRYEHEMICWNRRINPNMNTVLLVPPHELSLVSSSAIKGLVGFDGWQHLVEDFIDPCVITALERKYNAHNDPN